MVNIENKEFLKYKQRGFALILTLWVLMILSVLVLTFTMSVNSNIENASYLKDKIQASVYAEGAIQLIAVNLIPPKDKNTDSSSSSGSSDSDSNSESSSSNNGSSASGSSSSSGSDSGSGLSSSEAKGNRSGDKVDEKQVEWFFEKLGKWYVDSENWSLSQNKSDSYYTDNKPVIIECVVTAEDAKFPLNSISKLKELPASSNMSPIVFSSIKEFLENKSEASDTGSTAASNNSSVQTDDSESGTSNNASSEKSSSTNTNDKKKSSGSFSCVAELLEVKDVDSDIFDGDIGAPGLKDYMTVFSDGKIYINGATKEALALVPGIDSGAASQIANQAQTGSYLKNFDNINSMIGANSADVSKAKQWLSLIPKYFRIKAKAEVHGISCTAECVVKIEKNNLKFVLTNRG